MRDEIEKKVIELPPFKKICMTIGELPTSYLETMTYYEMLIWFTNYLRDTIIPTVNNNAEAIEELQGLFVKLQTYVNDYFDNLDVQEEINNKLDDMAEDGTLQEIIITYLNTKAIFGFDTVSDMIADTNLIDESYARTLGYHSINDGGGALYRISDTYSSDDYYETLTSGLYAILIDENLNVKQFGAYGDGIHDDTTAIQTALNHMKDGDSLYFPKVSPSNYLITEGLTLSANDATIYSDPRCEYDTKISSTENITILTVTGYGCKIKSLVFWGNGSNILKSTTNGVVLNRSSLGDLETYANIDAEIKDCAFFYLNDAICVKGRNLYVHDNVIVICHRGIVGLPYKYNNESQYSTVRGIRITNNRFHSMNDYYNSEEYIIDPNTMNSWCIQMPEDGNVQHLEICNNNIDFGYAGFYKGYICGANICNNTFNRTPSIFIKADGSNPTLTDEKNSFWGVIENNIIRSFANVGARKVPLNEYFIYIKNYNNISINNNNFRGSAKECVILENQGRCDIYSNVFQYFGYTGTTDETKYPAIYLKGTYNRIHITNNFITNTIDYSIGVKADTYNNGAIYMSNNHYDAISKLLEINPINIKSQEYGLDWVKPTLSNNFEYSTELTSPGYRKLENGKVVICMYIKGGTDNTTVFTLPVGYRPKRPIRIPNISQWQRSNDSAICQINANTGEVKINFDSGLSSPENVTFCINFEYEAVNVTS